MQLPDAHRHFVEQFHFGAKGVKPTCLRALNLGSPDIVAAALADGQEMWRTRPTTMLKGTSSDGGFRTAASTPVPFAGRWW